MSNATNVLTTIPASPAPAPEATPDAGKSAAEPAPPGSDPTVASSVASDAGATSTGGDTSIESKPDPTDQQLELAEKFDQASRQIAKARRFESKLKEREQSLEQREKAIAEKERDYASFEEDPIAWYMNKGKDPVEAAKRFARPMTEEEKRIKALEEAEAKRNRDAEEADKRWKEQQKQRQTTAAMRTFVSTITAEECPNLVALYDAGEVPELLTKMMARPVPDPTDETGRERVTLLQAFKLRHGRGPTDAELRKALEHEAEGRATRILKRQPAAEETSQTSVVDDQQPSAAPKPSPATQDTGPSSISNRHAATTSTSKKRPTSIEEKRKQGLGGLKAALEAQGADRGKD